MELIADITVFDQWGQICALVEVKALHSTTTEDAIEVRRGVLAQYGFVPRFFLFVARDSTYLWTTAAAPNALPDQRHSTGDVFAHYLRAIHTDASSIAPGAMELTVGIWLTDLIAHAAPGEAMQWVASSGLMKAVANGRIQFLDAA